MLSANAYVYFYLLQSTFTLENVLCFKDEFHEFSAQKAEKSLEPKSLNNNPRNAFYLEILCALFGHIPGTIIGEQKYGFRTESVLNNGLRSEELRFGPDYDVSEDEAVVYENAINSKNTRISPKSNLAIFQEFVTRMRIIAPTKQAFYYSQKVICHTFLCFMFVCNAHA